MQLAASVAAERHEDQGHGDSSLALGVVGGQAEQGRDETVHERRIGLHRLLARGTAQMGRSKEVDVRVQVLAEQLETQPATPVGAVRRGAGEAEVDLALDAPELAKEFRRHGETLARSAQVVKLGANLCGGYNERLCGNSGGRSSTR